MFTTAVRVPDAALKILEPLLKAVETWEDLGFGKFVPGFDFLQNIAKGASQTLPQMPNLSNWIAPTNTPAAANCTGVLVRNGHSVTNTSAISGGVAYLTLEAGALVVVSGTTFKGRRESWSNIGDFTYVQLSENSNPQDLQNKFHKNLMINTGDK